MDDKIDILLFGLGAIGGFYAFILQRSPSVRLKVCARSQYDAIKANGLHIKSDRHGEHHFTPAAVLKLPADADRTFDYVICCNKAIDQAAVAESLRPVVEEGKTSIVILQNGVGNEEPFHAAFPRCPILSGVVWVGAVVKAPGVIEHFKSEHTTIGLFENPGVALAVQQAMLQRFTDFFKYGNHPFTVKENIQTARWEKVIWNIAWNALTTLTGCDTETWLHSSPEAMSTTKRLMGEAVDVAKACGVPEIEHTLVDTLIEEVLKLGKIYSSMYQDSWAGRAMEVDVILGVPVRKGKEMGVALPTLEAVYALVKAVDLRMESERVSRTRPDRPQEDSHVTD